MKKVGIVSCYFKNNYGSILQAYATQKFLDENNIPNETINISQLSDFTKGKRKYYFSQILNFSFIKAKLGMIKLKWYSKTNKKLKKNFAMRKEKFETFKRLFNLTKPFFTYKELYEYSDKVYTDVVVGSDQLWLPVNVVADYYTLSWVPDEINKISYSTSFGVSSIPRKYNEKYKNFLKRINYLSVREDTGVKLIKEISDLNAKLVCDPTILLTKEEWNEIAVSERIVKEKYIFCYFLGNNIEHRKFVEKLKDKTGFKIVSINHCDEYVRYSDKFADVIPYDVGPGEFINYIRNAEYVCTDSFHGTVFSLINNVKFYTFRRFKNNSKMSTNSRVESLLNLVNLNNRLIYGTEDIKEIYEDIDFKYVNRRIGEIREDSKKWLLSSLKWKPNDIKCISIDDKTECCGCTACYNVCPNNAISMVEDEEGFLYPKVDNEKCSNCGLCKKSCPIVNRKKEIVKEQTGYIINNKDKEIRKESTSGGAFSAIADYVISKGGIVYGAAFDKNFVVEHKDVDNIYGIASFRNSKYVQSDLKDSFKKVKKYLDDCRLVCFSGTPCQIEGLKSYLKKDYENLILVDIVCHAVPSPKVFRLYLNYIKQNKLNNEQIEKVLFRDKSKYGYKYTLMTIKSKNYIYQEGIDTDPYLRAFFSGLSIRPSCEICRFKKRYRLSDFTMWDCFNVEDYDQKLDDNCGTTRLLVHSEKGKKIFEIIKEKFDCKYIEIEELIRGSKELIKSANRNPESEEFFLNLNSLGYNKTNSIYFKNNIRTKTERFARRRLVNTKYYKRIKKILKKIFGKY